MKILTLFSFFMMSVNLLVADEELSETEKEASITKVVAGSGVWLIEPSGRDEGEESSPAIPSLRANETADEARRETAAQPTSRIAKERKNSLKFRAAAFYPQGSLTRQIYGRYWPEGSIEFDHLFSKHWAFFLNGAYTRRNGHSIGEREKTTITLVPVTLGINAKFGGRCVHPYLGLGVGGAYAHFFNDSSFVKRYENKWGVASIAQAGIEFDLRECLFFDLFAAYRFNWFAFNHHHPHRLTGGGDVGASIGFRF
ncbi:MAG: hypothetical protein HYX48_03885 [Chlamydiales bacterium]|nr:hypothetical protein [Chlamydiales bacterium]